MTTTVDITSPIAPAVERVLEVFDDEVASDLPLVNRLLDQVRHYRGKLLRPKLLLLAGKATGELRRRHIVLGAVVEMVHMATLVHDDVLDEADVRRRGPTVNRTWGNEGAVLLGDYLISHAYHLCSSLGSTHDALRVAAVTNTVCEGELMQIEHRDDLDLTEATYLEIIRRKTAALTSVCCELGATASGADLAGVEHMAAFGRDLGIAFQIVDDLLDLTATQSETGKTVGRDAELGKLTLPLIHFRDHASAQQAQRLRAILSGDRSNKTDLARALLAGSDAIDYAMDVARSYVQSAAAHLSPLPAGDAKDALLAAAEFTLQRRG
jgi:octaprenyl-diphosphate synthase